VPDQRFQTCTIHVHAHYLLHLDVYEIDSLLGVVEVHGDYIVQSLSYDPKVLSIESEIAYVIPVAENQPRLDVVLLFARLLVNRFLVSVAAFATVIPVGISTQLRASIGLFIALIYISAPFLVGHQSVSRVAFAVVTREGVDTTVRTLMLAYVLAFVDIAVNRWGFVGPIQTIGILVAHQLVIYALTTVALVLTAWTRRYLALTFFRILVTPIRTVSISVAVGIEWNTTSVAAREFKSATRSMNAVEWLIRSVTTIVISIAFPLLRNADVTEFTLEFPRSTGTSSTVLKFIFGVAAVTHPVAHHTSRNARISSGGSVR
jgi:hypothetical protein